jgi:FMN-dependent oxidoreductase (nitrilotriacetate monooxygenase family)
VEYAKLLEGACFDGLFFADNNGYHDTYRGSVDAALQDAAQIPANDPTYIVAAMASATSKLGFGVTSSTAYEHPYDLARKFSTLDHLSKGRVGWNVVTSYSESAAKNRGLAAQQRHDDRYGRAQEYINVCLKLWEGSWEDDAVVHDRASGTFVDPSKVHAISHAGEHFTVPGIHMCEPSLQRTPVIFQAGGSPRGVKLAAESAEGVFMNDVSKQSLKGQVDRLRAATVEAGRREDSIVVLQLVTVICAATDEQAQQKYEEHFSYFSLEGALARYSGWTGLDLSTLDLDTPLVRGNLQGNQTLLDIFTKYDPDKVWTPREIAKYMAIGGTAPVIVGGPKTVADELESWVHETGINGFNLGHAVQYQDIKDFIDFVVPELQQRGAMRTSYEESTLRERLFGAGKSRLQGDHPGAAYRMPRESVR